MGKTTTYLPSKYKYRKEQILHYIILAGEIPSDLYKLIGITEDNFRATLCRCKKEELIKNNRTNKLAGYTLSTRGKEIICNHIDYEKYRKITITPTNDIQKRHRMRMFAEIYAALDYTDIVYEHYLKPSIEQSLEQTSRVYFYTSVEYKALLGRVSDTVQGSKAYGILCNKNNFIPVYKTKKELPDFTTMEFKLLRSIEKYLNKSISKGVLLCDSKYACSNITEKIINGSTRSFKLIGYDYYKNLLIIPTDEHFKSQIWTVFNEERVIEQLNKQYHIQQKKEDYIVNDGFVGDCPIIYSLNVEVPKLKQFLNFNRNERKKAYIVCYDYMKDTILSLLTEDNVIEIITVKPAEIERMV